MSTPRGRRSPLMTAMTTGPGRSTDPAALAATMTFVAGGTLIIWSAAIHLDLWTSGYRDIATIGNLFLVQFALGLLLGVAVIAVRQLWVTILGAGFALATLAGFVVSVETGLFGFQDSWGAPFAVQAFAIEIAAVATLVLAGLLCIAWPSKQGRPARLGPAQDRH